MRTQQAADPSTEEEVEGEPDLHRVLGDVGAADLGELGVDALLGGNQLGPQGLMGASCDPQLKARGVERAREGLGEQPERRLPLPCSGASGSEENHLLSDAA
jgi:hypothetical protein